jgi:hypothetical protein
MAHTLFRPIRLGILLAAGPLVLACESRSPLEVNGIQTRSLSVAVGTQFGIRLSTVGPGEYGSPPTLSDSALQFLDAAFVGPNNPGGATQLFRFHAAAQGRSIVTFQHSEGGYSVTDTVNVY